MALPIGISYQTGFTLAATLVRLSDGAQWRQAATAGWAAAGTDTFANRKIALTEGTSDYIGLYKATTDVSGLGDAGFVRVIFHNDGASDQTIATVTTYIWGGNEVTPADVLAISHDSTAADNAELMFDGTGYAGGTQKLGVDVVQISGDTTAANNAELAFDGNGYGFTGCTMPTVTDVTNMVTANAIQISGDATAADNLEAMFDGAGYAGGTIPLNVNVLQISGDATAADNCEAFFDGAGYAGGTIKLDVNLVSAAANTITASALATDAVTEIASAISALQFTRTGTAQAGGASTITLDASASATDDIYNGLSIRIISGTGLGQTRTISDYVGATKVATVDVAWTTTPDATSVFVIEPLAEVDLSTGAVSDIWAFEIETGVTAWDCVAYAAAGVLAVLSGAETTEITVRAIGNAGTTRAVVTVTPDGNRTGVILTAPSA